MRTMLAYGLSFPAVINWAVFFLFGMSLFNLRVKMTGANSAGLEASKPRPSPRYTASPSPPKAFSAGSRSTTPRF